jgi:hypothetical protein
VSESFPELIPFNQQVHQVLSDARPQAPELLQRWHPIKHPVKLIIWSRNDVFFDMEGFPLIDGGLEYLFGASYLQGDSSEFADSCQPLKANRADTQTLRDCRGSTSSNTVSGPWIGSET